MVVLLCITIRHLHPLIRQRIRFEWHNWFRPLLATEIPKPGISMLLVEFIHRRNLTTSKLSKKTPPNGSTWQAASPLLCPPPNKKGQPGPLKTHSEEKVKQQFSTIEAFLGITLNYPDKWITKSECMPMICNALDMSNNGKTVNHVIYYIDIIMTSMDFSTSSSGKRFQNKQYGESILN